MLPLFTSSTISRRNGAVIPCEAAAFVPLYSIGGFNVGNPSPNRRQEASLRGLGRAVTIAVRIRRFEGTLFGYGSPSQRHDIGTGVPER